MIVDSQVINKINRRHRLRGLWNVLAHLRISSFFYVIFSTLRPITWLRAGKRGRGWAWRCSHTTQSDTNPGETAGYHGVAEVVVRWSKSRWALSGSWGRHGGDEAHAWRWCRRRRRRRKRRKRRRSERHGRGRSETDMKRDKGQEWQTGWEWSKEGRRGDRDRDREGEGTDGRLVVCQWEAGGRGEVKGEDEECEEVGEICFKEIIMC